MPNVRVHDYITYLTYILQFIPQDLQEFYYLLNTYSRTKYVYLQLILQQAEYLPNVCVQDYIIYLTYIQFILQQAEYLPNVRVQDYIAYLTYILQFILQQAEYLHNVRVQDYITYLTYILQFILQEHLLKHNTVCSLHRIPYYILQFILQEQTDYLPKNNTVRSLHRIPYPHSPVHTPKTTRRSRSKSSCVSAECTKFAFV
jgi:hypothetical protein